MKYKYFLIASFLFFIACDKTDESIIANETMLAGKWEQTEAYISSGGPQYWIDVENGDEFNFFENGTFSSNRFTECSDGSFFIIENELLLEYECSGLSTEYQNERGFITYDLEFYSDYFIVTPTSGPICIEGCSFKYQKK